jgi:DNA-binding MarR family transcriptional regulator
MPALDPMDSLFELERATAAAFEALGNALASLGITVAGWRVLRMLARAPTALSVARIAADLQLRRQSIQRVVDDLVKEGILEFAPSPHHRRAKLVMVALKGRTMFSSAMEIERRLLDGLERVLTIDRVETVLRFLVDLTAVASAPTTASSRPPPNDMPAELEPISAVRSGDGAALRSLLEGSPKPFLVAGATQLILQARVLATVPVWADALKRKQDGAEFALEVLAADAGSGEKPLSADAFGERTLMRVVGLSAGEAIDLIDSRKTSEIEPIQNFGSLSTERVRPGRRAAACCHVAVRRVIPAED